jgi:hypothetical protein
MGRAGTAVNTDGAPLGSTADKWNRDAIRRIIDMDEDTLNLEIRKFLKEVGVTSQREIEKVVRSGKVRGDLLQLRMTLSSETAPLDHVVEGTIKLGAK